MHLRDARFTKTTLILLIAIFTITGCGGRLTTDKGNRVTQTNFMVLLKDGNQKGEWKTNELAIKYQYQITPESLNISGTTELVGGYALGFNWIEHLAVYLLFLDNQGIVIEKTLIYSTGNHHAMDSIPMVFDSKIPIPEGALKISFAYEGELMGAAAADRTTYNIRFSPTRR